MIYDYSKEKFMFLAYLLILHFSKLSTLNFIESFKLSRQNDVCLNHTSGEFAKNPNDCRSFYLCMDNGQAVLAPCPPTMVFNPVSKLCDTTANVNCDTDWSNDSNNNNNNTENNNNKDINNNNNYNEVQYASQYCASQSHDQSLIVFIGSSINCQRYFLCYYGKAVLQECSANLHWNRNTAKCDLPENAGCSLWNGDNGISTVAPTPENGDISNIDNNQNSGINELINCPIYGQHIFPHMTRCEYFIYCVKGYAILQQCPFYYNFDIVSKSCKWRTSAVCVRNLNINFRKFIGH